jgi:tetratricopeptide (TPR) repeat protein
MMSRLPTLLDLAACTQKVEGEFVAGLTSQERRAVGAPDDWSAKDLVAHVTTWRERGAVELEAIHHGPLPPEAQEFDEVNRAIFDDNHRQAWKVVLRRTMESWEAYLTALRHLTEDLLSASASADPADRPLWRRVTVDAGNHPVLHYAEFARRRGRTAAATRWMEEAVPRLLAVDPAEAWHGVVHYNLACHYAQSGLADKALESLRVALGLHPGLTEWSRTDSDLAPLHGDPRFSRIVGTAA